MEVLYVDTGDYLERCRIIERDTECPKSYRKSLLHLLEYKFSIYLSRCITDLRLILGHSVDGDSQRQR